MPPASDNRATWPTGPGRGTRERQRHHRPQISHAIRLEEVSTMSENVAIPALLIHDSKESRGNCMRNCWLAAVAGFQGDAPSHTSATWYHWCGGHGGAEEHRRDWRARLRRPWAAGPGQATHRHPDRLEAAARPAGPGRASRRRAERSSRRGRLAGGQAARRPEICRGNKQQLAARAAGPSGARNTRGATSIPAQQGTPSSPAQQGNARRSSPSEPCARAGASHPGRSGCGPRCAAPRLRCR